MACGKKLINRQTKHHLNFDVHLFGFVVNYDLMFSVFSSLEGLYHQVGFCQETEQTEQRKKQNKSNQKPNKSGHSDEKSEKRI